MTPDWAARATAVPYAVFGDPQSLNLYICVRNDPVSRADADGHCSADPKVEDTSCDPNGPAQRGQKNEKKAQQQQSDEIAGQINHETMGMKDSKTENESLASAENKIAHVRLNGIKKWGSNAKAQKYASLVSAIKKGPGFKLSQQAVEQAIREDSKGIDPTSGAIYYNMRTESQFRHGGTFQGQTVHTASGPYISPSKYTYIMTYGPPLN